jgi:phosphate transport system substrate-binding protein
MVRPVMNPVSPLRSHHLTGKAQALRAAAIALILILLALRAFAASPEVKGAGATFPYPLYVRWAAAYLRESGVKINYSAIGSSKGVERLKEGRADFAASDIPLTASGLEKAGLIQFPMAVGGVVPVVNVEGVKGDFKITPGVLADIFLGKIKRWDDRKIASLNPGLRLPAALITVFHRSDGSGTTWIFTDYLSKVSPEWKDSVGRGAAVSWPVGLGRAGNAGVAAAVKDTKNSLGYAEYAYAAENWLKRPLLKNRDGEFVKPFINSFVSASKNADWEKVLSGEETLTDEAGKGSWPITAATFILVKKDPKDCGRTMAALDFFGWAYRSGADMAEENTYMPLPKEVYEGIEERWTGIDCARAGK